MRPRAVLLARFLALLLSLAAVPAAWGWAFPMPVLIGPAIRFSRVPSAGTSAYYSILVGVQGSQAAVSPCVKLVVKSGKVATSQQVLDAYGGYTFVRWKLQVALGSKQQAVSYQVVSTCTNIRLSSNATAAYTFYVPSKTQSWHWGYYSCNGHPSLADAPPTGIDPLWNDLLKQHASRPMHLVAGNGDQLYNDGVLASDPAIQAAATADETDLTLNFKWTDASRAAASDWFFSHYAFHWSLYSTPYRKALASIPFTMMLDDHEMLNGYGSQPTSIFNTDLVQGLGALGRRFYLLFQQHSTPALMMEDLAWNKAGPALHIVSRLGPGTAILVPDVRFERTANQVMSPASYTRIQQQLNALPTSVKQLVVLTPQPMAFPVITELEDTVLKAVSVFGLNNWSEVQDYLESPVGRGGLLPILKQNFRLQFGTPDISDVLDQWSCVNHREERAKFVSMLQAWSMQRKARVTYLAGDAHLAFANQFQSAGSVPVAKDYRYSLSLISSAIGNNGNKAGALLLEATGEDFQDTLDSTGKTVITELAAFNDIKGLPLGSKYGAAARNWLDVSESSAGELVMTLRFESYGFRLFPPGQVFQPVTKTFKVPRLTI